MKYEIKTSFLEEFVEVKGGKRLPKGANLQTTPNSHPYIRIRDLGSSKVLELNSAYEYVDDETQKTISRYIVSEGDLLISIVGTIGLVGIVGKSLEKANLTENCVKLVNIDGIDREYLYYYFASKLGQDEIAKGTVGAVQPKLPIKNIQRIAIKHPVEIDIQRKIASILRSIDEKIALNNAINNNLEQQAKAIYHQMFIASSSPEWTQGTLSDIADITMGQSPSGSSYNEDGIGTVFYQGRAEFGYRFPTQRLCTTEPKRMARENDVLMSVRAPVGDLNVAREDCCIGRGLASIRSKDNHQSFVLYTVFALQPELDKFNGEGTVFGSINRDSLNKMTIEIPTADEMERFESLVSPMDAQIRTNHEEILRLEAIRDALLPKLMSGELDVSDVEI